MKLLSSQPFWPIRDGLPATYPPLERDVRCDVAIVGGGITGALVAWHLVAAGIDAIVLDRREVAHGSTAGSTSLLRYEIDEPLYKLAQEIGVDRAARSYRRCCDAIDAIARLVKKLHLHCGFERKSSLLLASQRSHVGALRKEFDARRAAGFDVAWWSRARLLAESSLPQPAAIHSSEGAQVDAYLLTHGLLAAARKRGAQIHDRTAVTRTRFHSRGVELQTSRGCSVRARRLVVASGYEAGSFLPESVTELHSTFAIISEPLKRFTGWPADRCLIWETARPYVYLRTTDDHRAIIGGYDEPFRDPTTRDRMLPAKSAALQRRFRQFFPRIPFEQSGAWAGTFAETAHGLPYIGRHAKVPHTWFALGYGGNGITYSLLAAELIRDQMLGRVNRDEELFGFERKI